MTNLVPVEQDMYDYKFGSRSAYFNVDQDVTVILAVPRVALGKAGETYQVM